jgi:hypothetical protein
LPSASDPSFDYRQMIKKIKEKEETNKKVIYKGKVCMRKRFFSFTHQKIFYKNVFIHFYKKLKKRRCKMSKLYNKYIEKKKGNNSL